MTLPILSRVAEAVRAGPKLRDYQQKLFDDIHNAWSVGHRNVLAVLPTGGGKTVVLSSVVLNHQGASCVIAHRQELVSQISVALARNGVRHRIIGPNKLIRMIVALQMVEVGVSYYDPQAPCAVAGVDTLVRRGEKLASWLPTVTLWIQDEAHHVLRDNKWGKAAAMFPNAKGLGVTATPCRADGNGLGRHAQGLMDVMVEGPTMRELIRRKYLTEYRIICPPSDLSEHMGGVKTSTTTGDYNEHDVKAAVAASGLVAHDEGGSRVVGDIVSTYKQRFMGMLSVVFVPGVAMAEDIAQQFRDEGISAVALSANTPDDERAAALRKMKRREIHVITNAALFSEGTDIPALEVVQDAYPTQSLGMFMQRFGRVLRLMEGKTHGIYCDHAANVKRHGLPDKPREWTLDAREKRCSAGSNDAQATRTCLGTPDVPGCYAVFERFLKACPYCGLEIPPPSDRSGPEFVDGDLYELDEATLAAMRGEVARVDTPVVPPLTPEVLQAEINRYRTELQRKRTPKVYEMTHCKRHGASYAEQYEVDRQAHIAQKEAVTALREVMAEWGGYHRAAGRDDGEIMRRFYVAYGVDWLSAQALSADAACELMMRVAANVGEV